MRDLEADNSVFTVAMVKNAVHEAVLTTKVQNDAPAPNHDYSNSLGIIMMSKYPNRNASEGPEYGDVIKCLNTYVQRVTESLTVKKGFNTNGPLKDAEDNLMNTLKDVLKALGSELSADMETKLRTDLKVNIDRIAGPMILVK